MTDQLSKDLLEKLRSRAADPGRRTDVASLGAGSVGIDEMLSGMSKSDDPKVREYLQGINSPFAGAIGSLASGDPSQARGLIGALSSLMGNKQVFGTMGNLTFSLGATVTPSPAPEPASEEQVQSAEARLGFALPLPLRQFYLEVADGGVGPGEGIYGLDQLTSKYAELTSEPAGPQGQPWPADLLPIQGEDYDFVSIDRSNLMLTYWDVEEVDIDDDAEPDNPSWAASFKFQADSLEAWLSSWADRGPSPRQG